MITRLTFTPWQVHEELLLIKKQLFWSRNGGDLDKRRKACNHVSMWKRRGNLPHKIESTAFLTDAVLHDNVAINSTFAIRAVYSAAFCRYDRILLSLNLTWAEKHRFVTGLVDTNLGARYRPTMYAKARTIGLPASFVELRHRATHNDLPSLVVLRQAAKQSLQWLWNNYWQLIDIRSSNLLEDVIDVASNGREQLRDRCKESLANYVKTCKAVSVMACCESSGNGKDSSSCSIDSAGLSPEARAQKTADEQKPANVLSKEHPKSRAEQVTLLELQGICHNRISATKLLVEVLLDNRFLIPQNRLLGAKLDNHFESWDVLLSKLADSQSEFLSSLTDGMLVRVIQESSIDKNLDPYREALALWLRHIYISETWRSSLSWSSVNVNTAIATCLQNPNRWTLEFGRAIIESPFHKSARTRYEATLSKASEAYEKGEIHGTKGQPPTSAWHEWEGYWAPIPIGMVPSR